ncbi:conserved protein of unknown function [Rhodovastum atsumiense]|uniref:Uncharacterized protein n=1 Tax=Rhodovastum atsumiense TaxID=504468 RepID=A0A5M6IN88_9PROT|nr:hypothetical protein [Rhodovastum atsumiense]KAA5609457.1 hypothetical protein F1189_24130 [Rhodovastum atsumiense]CAH2603539.1 conserved protein of unknown function [Rhodovastum atsumiense]
MTGFAIRPLADPGDREISGALVFSPAPEITGPVRFSIERFNCDLTVLGAEGWMAGAPVALQPRRVERRGDALWVLFGRDVSNWVIPHEPVRVRLLGTEIMGEDIWPAIARGTGKGAPPPPTTTREAPVVPPRNDPPTAAPRQADGETGRTRPAQERGAAPATDAPRPPVDPPPTASPWPQVGPRPVVTPPADQLPRVTAPSGLRGSLWWLVPGATLPVLVAITIAVRAWYPREPGPVLQAANGPQASAGIPAPPPPVRAPETFDACVTAETRRLSAGCPEEYLRELPAERLTRIALQLAASGDADARATAFRALVGITGRTSFGPAELALARMYDPASFAANPALRAPNPQIALCLYRNAASGQAPGAEAARQALVTRLRTTAASGGPEATTAQAALQNACAR